MEFFTFVGTAVILGLLCLIPLGMGIILCEGEFIEEAFTYAYIGLLIANVILWSILINNPRFLGYQKIDKSEIQIEYPAEEAR